jgi:dihydroxyacetone kinase
MGIHNEPVSISILSIMVPSLTSSQGLRTLSPMPSTENIIKEMLKYLLDPNDSDRAFVPFSPSDNVVMLVNNFGGLSGLEFEALVNLTLVVLKRDYSIVPSRIYAGILETSLNGQGFSITLGNMTGMAKSMDVSVDEIIELLDAPTNAPAWPKNNYVPVDISKETQELSKEAWASDSASSAAHPGPATPSSLIPGLKNACKAALAAEPTITQYDLQMGDGDCGEAVAQLCKFILNNISSVESSPPPLIKLLESIAENVEDVGGSLGAILSILVTAFTNALAAATRDVGKELDEEIVADAAAQALENLKRYTAAREGDRTVMDVLIPFIREFKETRRFGNSVKVAVEKADQTKLMKPKFGRATYVGDGMGEERSRIPDPGAYAAGVWLKGLVEGWGI